MRAGAGGPGVGSSDLRGQPTVRYRRYADSGRGAEDPVRQHRRGLLHRVHVQRPDRAGSSTGPPPGT
jgi:hypothetical protein